MMNYRPVGLCLRRIYRCTLEQVTFNTFGLVMTSKSNKLIFIPDCSEVENSAKFPQAVDEIRR